MFNVSKDQMLVMEQARQEEDFQELMAEFVEYYEELDHQPMLIDDKPVSLEYFLRTCFVKANKLNFQILQCYLDFMLLNYVHGWEFWLQEPYLWADKILHSDQLDETRIELIAKRINQELLQQLWRS